MGIKEKLNQIGMQQLTERGHQLIRYMESVDDQLRALGQAFNENMTKFQKEMTSISEKIDELREKLDDKR